MLLSTVTKLPGCDSGGAGQYRGGAGIRRDIKFIWPGHFLSITKKSKTPPWSLAGGKSTKPNANMDGYTVELFTYFPNVYASDLTKICY